MKWHKISEELPPENKPLLFKSKEWVVTKYVGAKYKKGINEIFPYIGCCTLSLTYFSHWAEIEQPNNKTNVDK
jgi:hypothetical protein